MDKGVPIAIVVWFGLNQGLKAIGDDAVMHNDDTDAANTGALTVRGLKIDGGKIFHCFRLLLNCSVQRSPFSFINETSASCFL